MLAKGNAATTLDSHAAPYARTPGIAAGAGTGTWPSISVADKDRRGAITITTGTTPAAELLATVNFSAPGSRAADLGYQVHTPARCPPTTWQLEYDGTPTAATTCKFGYVVLG